MTDRIPIAELTRLAFLYAIQDRMAMVDALGKDNEWLPEAKSELRQLRAVYKRRWGKTNVERLLENAEVVTLDQLRAEHRPK